MADLNEEDITAFEEDLKLLIKTIQDSFEAEKIRHFLDDRRNTLYVEIEGLDEYTQEEIAEIANPIFDELDLDFDEIALLPLQY